MTAEGIGGYPRDIEAAVYFCCLEALQNLQKHVRASHAVIRLRGDDTRLRFEVQDDGAGFDMATIEKGSGLTNMVDRLDALGGEVTVISAPGQGTGLQGSLPITAGVAVPVPAQATASGLHTEPPQPV